jgi:hypothetical protein
VLTTVKELPITLTGLLGEEIVVGPPGVVCTVPETLIVAMFYSFRVFIVLMNSYFN